MQRRLAALTAPLLVCAALAGCAASETSPPSPTPADAAPAPSAAAATSAAAPAATTAAGVAPTLPAGQFAQKVSVGDYALFLTCDGQGSPSVILDAGLGGTHGGWSTVQAGVARFARVCSYDRAGVGNSDPGVMPRTSEQIVAELHALLANAGVPGPYILAGHSFGGFNVRLYASRHPDEVAGLLLVESTHEDQDARILAALPPEEPDEHPGLAAYRQELRADVVSGGEPIAFKTSGEQVRASGTLGDLPVVVISGGRSAFPQFDGEDQARLDSTWRDLQSLLLGISTNSRQIIAERSGHCVPCDEPELVIDTIRQMTEQAGQP